MAKIVPFRGLRYNLARFDNPAGVMAPPYDVISPALQEDLYRRDPFNVVRLILGKTAPTDNDADNRYTRAAAEFALWQEQGVLARDAEPSIYLYDQKYPIEGGEMVVRKGFMALTRLEDFSSGMVKPHEKTLAGPKADRLLLTKACGANFSPIFSLYADPCCVVESLARKEKEEAPEIEVADDDGVIHRLWPVTDRAIIEKAQELLDNKPLFIADGHHRYETAMNYRDFMREKTPGFSGKELFNYVLMYFANMEDQGLMIFPTHRLVFNLPDFRLLAFLGKLKEHFTVEEEAFDPADAGSRLHVRDLLREKGRDRHALAVYAGGETVYFLGLRNENEMDRFFDAKSPKALRTLDVSILHRLILEDILGITAEAQEQQTHLRYVKNFEEPFSLVRGGEAQISFLMNATRMSEVRDVANSGEKMPQKSTYFYPKLLTGLVINKIVEGEGAED
ncbi:MAG: DUF1015 domain-containing protein [Desulfuromonadales bacterium]